MATLTTKSLESVGTVETVETVDEVTLVEDVALATSTASGTQSATNTLTALPSAAAKIGVYVQNLGTDPEGVRVTSSTSGSVGPVLFSERERFYPVANANLLRIQRLGSNNQTVAYHAI